MSPRRTVSTILLAGALAAASVTGASAAAAAPSPAAAHQLTGAPDDSLINIGDINLISIFLGNQKN